MTITELIQDEIKRKLEETEGLYHRLVLLVGATGSGKTGVLQHVAGNIGTKVINLNLTLSSELLDLTPKQRVLRLPEILDQVVNKTQTTVIFDNLEILFDKDLKQDPLRLLLSISRNRPVVASWNGTITAGKLIYAETNHPEYRSYDSIDALIVIMPSIDSTKDN